MRQGGVNHSKHTIITAANTELLSYEQGMIRCEYTGNGVQFVYNILNRGHQGQPHFGPRD